MEKDNENNAQRGEWILIKDKLPLKGKMVICYFSNNKMKMVKLITEDGIMTENFVTHWMYAPNSPNS